MVSHLWCEVGGCVNGEGREAEGGGWGGIFCFEGGVWVGRGVVCCGVWCVVVERMSAGGYCEIRKRVWVVWEFTMRLAG